MGNSNYACTRHHYICHTTYPAEAIHTLISSIIGLTNFTQIMSNVRVWFWVGVWNVWWIRLCLSTGTRCTGICIYRAVADSDSSVIVHQVDFFATLSLRLLFVFTIFLHPSHGQFQWGHMFVFRCHLAGTAELLGDYMGKCPLSENQTSSYYWRLLASAARVYYL